MKGLVLFWSYLSCLVVSAFVGLVGILLMCVGWTFMAINYSQYLIVEWTLFGTGLLFFSVGGFVQGVCWCLAKPFINFIADLDEDEGCLCPSV